MNTPRAAVGLALIGAAAGIAGGALPWYSVPNGVVVGAAIVSGTPPGSQTVDGLVALIAAGSALLLGAILMTGRMRRLLGALISIAGIVAVAAAVLAIRDPLKGYIDFALNKAGVSGHVGDIRLSLESLFRVNHLQANVGIGAVVSLVGGALVVLGGLLALVMHPRGGRISREDRPTLGDSHMAPDQPSPSDAPDPKDSESGGLLNESSRLKARTTARQGSIESAESPEKDKTPQPTQAGRGSFDVSGRWVG